jgi:hypothetical protein
MDHFQVTRTRTRTSQSQAESRPAQPSKTTLTTEGSHSQQPHPESWIDSAARLTKWEWQDCVQQPSPKCTHVVLSLRDGRNRVTSHSVDHPSAGNAATTAAVTVATNMGDLHVESNNDSTVTVYKILWRPVPRAEQLDTAGRGVCQERAGVGLPVGVGCGCIV